MLYSCCSLNLLSGMFIGHESEEENIHFRVWPHEAGRLYMLGIGDNYGG